MRLLLRLTWPLWKNYGLTRKKVHSQAWKKGAVVR